MLGFFFFGCREFGNKVVLVCLFELIVLELDLKIFCECWFFVIMFKRMGEEGGEGVVIKKSNF